MDPEHARPLKRPDPPDVVDRVTGELAQSLRAVAAILNAAAHPVDDLSDWSAYPSRACLPGEHLEDLSDLARFLGGDETSFTGKVLRLIEKAQFSPENLNRLARGFPHHVAAWVMWSNMSAAAPLTAADLKRLLEMAHGRLKIQDVQAEDLKGDADVRADG